MDKDFDQPDDFDELDEPDEPDDDTGSGLPWPPPGYSPPRNAAHRRGTCSVAVTVAATAVLAAAAGFLVVTAVPDGSASQTAANASPAPNRTAPGATAPYGTAPGGGAGNLFPPGTGGGAIPTPGPGQTLRLEIDGEVMAVSATSITLGAGGRQVTARVTPSTKVTGKVTGIGGVKVGDLVSAQITGADGKLTATAIQDPASIP